MHPRNLYFFCILASILLLSQDVTCSFWDSVPIVSQVKSAVQAIGGDSKGARQTQENFSRGFIIIAPVRAIVEHSSGNHDEARKTWSYLGKRYEGMVDSTPIVGHIKGGIHYAAGDSQRGDEIMKAASRPVGVAVGGVSGFIVGGPVGAVAGGIAGGVAADGIITGVESAINKEYKPSGLVNSVTKMATNEVTVEDVFDAGMNVVGDGIGGYAAGKAFNSYTSGKTGGSPSSNSKTSSTTNLIRCRRAAGAGCTTVNGVNKQPATNLNKPSPFNPNPNPSPFNPNPNPSPFNPNPIPRPATPSSSSSSYAGRTFSDGTFTDVSSVSSNISPRMSIQIQPPAVQLPPKISAHTYTIQALSASLPVGVKPPVNMGIAGPATKVAVGVNAAVGTKVDSHNPVQTNPVLVEVVNFDRQRKRKVLCNSQPEIRNRDETRMSACVGKRPNAKCNVHCRVGYRANRNRVRCVRTGVKDARWDIQNIECVPDGDVICRDGYNNPVDWFIMYRLPLNDPLPGTGLVKGDSFLFMSSRTPESYLLEGNTTTWTDWELSGLEPMDNTLQPVREDTRRIIRANNPNPLQYVMYNDAPPIGNAGGAHAKGIFASRNNLGFYLPHSLPRYPEANGNHGHSSTVYGQVFMCVSLSGQAELAKVAKHLIEIQANVYSRGGPSLTDMSDGAPILMHRRVSLSSRGQTQFDLFTKSPTDNIDIWSAAISDWYGDPMQIVTWIRGERRLRSVCPDIPNPDPEDAGNLAVENVRRLRFATDVDQEDIEAVFRSSEDHSKWGVGKGSRDNVFCVGDLDRMQSQFIKGGGALCFRNRQVADTFRDMVVATDCNIE